MNLADHFVANPNAPEVKVCGTGTITSLVAVVRVRSLLQRWLTPGTLVHATQVHLHPLAQ